MKKYFMFVLVIITLLIAGCGTTGNVVAQDITPTGEVKEVTIDSFNFGFTQTGDTINVGDTVRVKVTGSSGVHGIAIPDFGVSTGAIPSGQSETIEFVADKAGSFTYFCNVPCGKGHMHMREQIVVN